MESPGKADSRIYPSDVISRRTRRWNSKSSYPQSVGYQKPAVALPVQYQDDFMAIVNKPSGMICHSHSKGGFNNNSVLRVLPHVLTPPADAVEGAFEFPALVHRLDVDTSGLLVIAKTKPAAVHLSDQFASRQVAKTYTALIQQQSTILVEGEEEGSIDYAIDEKPAVTEWRRLRNIKTTKGPLMLIEFRPRHGRKHQLRRHASEVLHCPIVGDKLYGSTFTRTKLLLCATEITVKHPMHRTKLHVKIDPPRHFDDFIRREEKRFAKYEQWMLERGVQCLLDICDVAKAMTII